MFSVVTEREKELVGTRKFDSLVEEQKRIDTEIDQKVMYMGPGF